MSLFCQPCHWSYQAHPPATAFTKVAPTGRSHTSASSQPVAPTHSTPSSADALRACHHGVPMGSHASYGCCSIPK
eukprot:362138-Chlamydomonas_euryale.AAC.2